MRDHSSLLAMVAVFGVLSGMCLVPLVSTAGETMSADQRARIIEAYGAALNSRRSSTVGHDSELPFPKDRIRQAILEELKETSPENVDVLEVGYVELESFVSDDDFEAVVAFEKAVAQARALMASGNPEDTERAAQLISEAPERAGQVQQEIITRQEQRLRELRERK